MPSAAWSRTWQWSIQIPGSWALKATSVALPGLDVERVRQPPAPGDGPPVAAQHEDVVAAQVHGSSMRLRFTKAAFTRSPSRTMSVGCRGTLRRRRPTEAGTSRRRSRERCRRSRRTLCRSRFPCRRVRAPDCRTPRGSHPALVGDRGYLPGAVVAQQETGFGVGLAQRLRHRGWRAGRDHPAW